MSRRFGNFQHVIRAAAIFVCGFLLFLVVRAQLIPSDFGAEGFYRLSARADAMSRPLAYAGEAECVVCHTDQDELKKTGRHVTVRCEACHGPSWKHTQEPTDIHPAKLDLARLCVSCHTRAAGKPSPFPQIAPAAHYANRGCVDCHQPHRPKAEPHKDAGR